MSASQIPNLLTSRGGPRSRGRGRGRGSAFPDPPASSRSDLTIQATDNDAAVSRLSAVSSGYLDDVFAANFVNRPATRRLPIINRGTYARTNALDILINAFLSSSSDDAASSAPERQIISLGAGTDTRYFRLRAQNRTNHVTYHEFDFPAVCATKRRIVESHGTLCSDGMPAPARREAEAQGGQVDGEPGWELLRPREADGGSAMEPGYLCHALDLRQLPAIESLGAFRGLRSDLPTLVISECCLCYLEVDVAAAVLKWFVDRIPSLGVVLYEPLGVDDAFGRMMVGNLAARGIAMPTVQRFKSLSDQVGRLQEVGFGGDAGRTNAVTIEDVWNQWISSHERERVDALEGLDEVEEWQMLARHYAVVWGWRGGYVWETWRNLQHASPR